MDKEFSLREMAISLHELYLSFIEAGFTAEQAFELCKRAIPDGSNKNHG